MHAQVITYQLKDISQAEYLKKMAESKIGNRAFLMLRKALPLAKLFTEMLAGY